MFYHNRSLFSFTDDNYSNYRWIFTKLGVCIDIMEICFGIADGQILSILTSSQSCLGHIGFFHFWMITVKF